MELRVTLLCRPFDRVPVALACIAGTASKDQITRVAGAVFGNWVDVIDLKARGLFVAPEAPTLLSDAQGLDISLGVRPGETAFPGAAVGLVNCLVRFCRSPVFEAKKVLFDIVGHRIGFTLGTPLFHGLFGTANHAACIDSKSRRRLVSLSAWGSINVSAFSGLFRSKANGVLRRLLLGSSTGLPSADDAVIPVNISMSDVPMDAWFSGVVSQVTTLLRGDSRRMPGCDFLLLLFAPGFVAQGAFVAPHIDRSDVTGHTRNACEVVNEPPFSCLSTGNQDKRNVGFSHSCMLQYTMVRIGVALKTLCRSVTNLPKIAANCNGLRLSVGENRSFVF